MFTSRGILVCSLKILVLFNHRILQDWLRSSKSAMRFEFLPFGVFHSLCFLEVKVKLFDYFTKPNSLFSNFRVKFFLMFYFLCRNICVLNDVMETLIAIAHWWHCPCLNCVSGLWKLERNLNFLRCIFVNQLVLIDGSGIKKRNRVQLLFYFIALMSVVASVMKWIF